MIDSDFLLMDQNVSKNLRYYNLNFNSKLFSVVALDLFVLVKSMKQLIRLLHFLKIQKKKKLHLGVGNKQYLNLINTYILNDQQSHLVLATSFLSKTNVSGDVCQSVLFLGHSLKNDKMNFKRLFDKNIYLINKVNSKLESNNWGTYKIYNDLIDFKKIVFFMVLINKIFLLNDKKI